VREARASTSIVAGLSRSSRKGSLSALLFRMHALPTILFFIISSTNDLAIPLGHPKESITVLKKQGNITKLKNKDKVADRL
jgi:hypothetical protein